jgi:hypothetical protein
MVDITSLRSTAERLISENGRDVTLVKRDRTAGDGAKPWRGPASPGTDVSVTAKAVFVDFEEEDFAATLVRRGDKRALVSAKVIEELNSTAVLEEFDVVLDGTVEWKIVSTTIIEPGPSRVLYDLQLRK